MQLVLFLFLFLFWNSHAKLGGYEIREKLKRNLLQHYDRTAVPINRETDEGVNVTVYMWPYDILYVHEAEGAIKISGWIDMRWKDPFLTWDPADYDGVNETFLIRNQIWLPEIDIFYRSESERNDGDSCTQEAGGGIAPHGYGWMSMGTGRDQRCSGRGAGNHHFSKDATSMTGRCDTCPSRVTYEGKVLRGYYFAYSFPCVINVKYFPFDEHFCTLDLANWHLDDRNMDLYPEHDSVDLTIFLPNEEWDIKTVTVSRKRDMYNYGYFPILSYTIRIRRKPFYYICNLVIPTIILTITALIGYHMPSGGNGVHQEKVKMGLTTILSIFILQLGVSDKLPRTSNVVPLIAIFYSCMVGLLSLAIVATSFVILVEKQGIYEKPIPQWVQRIFFSDTQTVTPTSWSVHKCHARCRMLDCGCRLKKTPNYELLSNAISPAPNRKLTTSALNVNDVNMPKSRELLHSVLLEALADLKASHAEHRFHLEVQAAKARIRSDWCVLADKIENLSMLMFMIGAGLSIISFFYHELWY